jgi:excisionase family DNA binding protein
MNRPELPPGSGPDLPRVYTPDEIAEGFGISGWWVREQCRRRRIPFTRVGGAYRFTAEHVSEIVRIFEERPEQSPDRTAGSSMRSRPPAQSDHPTVQLHARRPRRMHGGGDGAT